MARLNFLLHFPTTIMCKICQDWTSYFFIILPSIIVLVPKPVFFVYRELLECLAKLHKFHHPTYILREILLVLLQTTCLKIFLNWLNSMSLCGFMESFYSLFCKSLYRACMMAFKRHIYQRLSVGEIKPLQGWQYI